MFTAAPPQSYHLECPVCHLAFPDDGLILECPAEHEPALLQTHYALRRLRPTSSAQGIDRYRAWLPARRAIGGVSTTITYRSEQLNRTLDMPNLWFAFNGFWPERGASSQTGTFKELEAYAVAARLPDRLPQPLALASAGNTAAAFAHVCSTKQIPCLIVLPESGLPALQLSKPLDEHVRVVCVRGEEAGYGDAILLVERAVAGGSFVAEGGVKNVARRDGLGTTMLNAAITLGRLPDYYFQAVGSGSGAIAAHEASKRLIGSGMFGARLPQLMLAQNKPFTPIHDAWQARSRMLLPMSENDCQQRISRVGAKVLANPRPPYTLRGGIYDVLTESDGYTFAVANEAAREADALFTRYEVICLEPAASVAFAAVLEARENRLIEHDAFILCHLTGGGRKRLIDDHLIFPASSTLSIERADLNSSSTIHQLESLFDQAATHQMN